MQAGPAQGQQETAYLSMKTRLAARIKAAQPNGMGNHVHMSTKSTDSSMGPTNHRTSRLRPWQAYGCTKMTYLVT